MKFVRARVGLHAIAVVLAVSPAVFADSWKSDYGTALQAARSAHKPLLVVLEMPSDRLSETTGSNDLSSSALLKPYELCCVDASTSLGQQVAEVLGAKQFPYTVITDKDVKNIIHRKAGHYSKLDWSSMLMTYRDGQKPPSYVSDFIHSAQTTPAVCFT
jgi:hypothetical protein